MSKTIIDDLSNMVAEQNIACIELDIARLRNADNIAEYFDDLIKLAQMLIDIAGEGIENENNK